MESENIISDAGRDKDKAKQFVEKNKELLTDKKYYQFAQKVKLLSNRKIQTKKYEESEKILQAGAAELYDLPESELEDNVCFELIEKLAEQYHKFPELLTRASGQWLVNNLKKRRVGEKQINLLTKLVKSRLSSEVPELSDFVIHYRIDKKEFSAVQRIVADMEQGKVLDFLDSWTQTQGITKDQIPAIWARQALMRGLRRDLNDGKIIVNKAWDLFGNNPYLAFAKFLIKATEIRSKEAYQTLKQSYETFLETDSVFKCLYNVYGTKFFGIEKSKSGLMSLLS